MTSKFVDAAAAAGYVRDAGGTPLETMLAEAVYTWLIESRSRPRGFKDAVDRRIKEMKEARARGDSIALYDDGFGRYSIVELEPEKADENESSRRPGARSKTRGTTDEAQAEELKKFPVHSRVRWFGDGTTHEGYVKMHHTYHLQVFCDLHGHWWNGLSPYRLELIGFAPSTIEFTYEEMTDRRNSYAHLFRLEKRGEQVVENFRLGTIYDLEKAKQIVKWLNIHQQTQDLEDLV